MPSELRNPWRREPELVKSWHDTSSVLSVLSGKLLIGAVFHTLLFLIYWAKRIQTQTDKYTSMCWDLNSRSFNSSSETPTTELPPLYYEEGYLNTFWYLQWLIILITSICVDSHFPYLFIFIESMYIHKRSEFSF